MFLWEQGLLLLRLYSCLDTICAVPTRKGILDTAQTGVLARELPERQETLLSWVHFGVTNSQDLYLLSI